MIHALIKNKPYSIPLLYIFNWLLLLDYAATTLIGYDPRLSVSTVLGIYLKQGKISLKWLPKPFRDHCLEAAYWWNYKFPVVNRSLWTKKSGDTNHA